MKFSIHKIVFFAVYSSIISISHLSAQESDVDNPELPLSAEELSWQTTTSIGTIDGYKKFLEKFPDSTFLTKRAAELAYVDRKMDKAYIRRVQLYPDALKGWDGEISTVAIGIAKIFDLNDKTKSAWGYLLSAERENPFSKGKMYVPVGFSINNDVNGDDYKNKRLLNKVPLPSDWVFSVPAKSDKKGIWVSDDGMSLHTVLVDGSLGSLQFYKKGAPSVAVPIEQLDRLLTSRIISKFVSMQYNFTGQKNPHAPPAGAFMEIKGFEKIVAGSLDVAYGLTQLKMEKAVFNGVEYWSINTFPSMR
jgi:hypothetical protein